MLGNIVIEYVNACKTDKNASAVIKAGIEKRTR